MAAAAAAALGSVSSMLEQVGLLFAGERERDLGWKKEMEKRGEKKVSDRGELSTVRRTPTEIVLGCSPSTARFCRFSFWTNEPVS